MTAGNFGSTERMVTIALDIGTMPETGTSETAPGGKHDTLSGPVIGASPRRFEAIRRFGENHRWPLSLTTSLLLHVAIAGALMIHLSSYSHEDAPPPAGMVVELAVMPSSPPVPHSEIPPGPEQVEAAPKPKPIDRMKFDPPPEVDPNLKPSFALPVKQVAKPVEPPVVAQEAPETTAPQSVEAAVRDKNEAPVEGNNAAPPSDAEQAWEGRLLARLERNKRYPAAAQSAGQQDTVFLRFVIDRQGNLLEASLKKSAGFALLDSETLAMAHRASPFPPPPASITGDRIVRIVPVEFYLKKRR